MSETELKLRFDHQDKILDDILTHAEKTNGRVNALENWRWFITGGLSIIAILLIPILLSVVHIK